MDGFTDIINKDDDTICLETRKNVTITAPIREVERQIEEGGTTQKWEDYINKWKDEGRI